MGQFLELKYVKREAVEERDYQTSLARQAVSGNSIVILPTGLGKTAVALQIIARRFDDGARVLFLAPTRVLVNQHHSFLSAVLETDSISVVTGEDPIDLREKKWASRVVCSTPEIARNDMERGMLDVNSYGLVIFDEVHRMIGDYAYSKVADRCAESGARLIGMTATLPSDEEKSSEITHRLRAARVLYRNEASTDVAPYTKKTGTEWVVVDLPPEMIRIQAHLKAALSAYYQQLMTEPRMGITERSSLKKLLQVQKDGFPKNMIGPLIGAIRLHQMILQIESHGVVPFNRYVRRLEDRAAKNILSPVIPMFLADPLIREAIETAKKAEADGIEHPKLGELLKILSTAEGRTLVFSSYRDSVAMIQRHLKEAGIRSTILIGKAGATGQKQKKQLEVVKDFRDGKYDVMVATRVGEEGLDIAQVNLVVFYDNVPSPIRYVQRRGRTGRHKDGRLVILVARGTVDEIHRKLSMRNLANARDAGDRAAKVVEERQVQKQAEKRGLDAFI
ncbi:MAG: DEAD/DEAH box helicase [Alphaproteobacteria bacterium]|nr:DEAD/DEAH box helicase [Alphaproteobacteria bacterium]MDA8029892.1 DEAD/DEAH box helicase [Alphaproteobacteria bacterium]